MGTDCRHGDMGWPQTRVGTASLSGCNPREGGHGGQIFSADTDQGVVGPGLSGTDGRTAAGNKAADMRVGDTAGGRVGRN